MRFATAILAVVAAVALAADDPPAKAPATAPAGEAEAPMVDTLRLQRHVEQLGSQSYRQRKEAREQLQRMLNQRGAVQEMKRLLKDSRDSEVRMVLEGLLEAYGQPLVMMWCRGAMQTYAGNKRYMRMDPGFPWMLVCGDGTFYCDASSPVFTGKAGELMDTDFREGKLTVEQLYRLIDLIDTSGVTRRAENATIQATTDPGTVEVLFHTRSGQAKRTSLERWTLASLDPKKKPASTKSDEGLAAAVRDLLVTAESKPYEGPYRAFARYEPVRDRNQVAKLPDWPVAGADVPQMMQQGGVELDEKQLRQAREALKKTQVFKYATHASCRVWLIPHVEKARELYYGTAR